MHHHRPRRLPAEDYRGPNRYSLTFCTADRQRHFTSALAVDLVLGEFRYSAAQEGYAILVYCFMEDHVHLVETESETADLQRFVKLMKQRSGFRFSKRFGQRLWQGSYFDRTLRSDEATEDAMRYILDNPVRAGLVRSPLEYPFMGSEYGPLEQILTDLGLRR